MSATTTNGKFNRDRNNDLVVVHDDAYPISHPMFEQPAETGVLEPFQLTRKQKESLHEEVTALELPLESFAQLAYLDGKEAEVKGSVLAEAIVRNEPSRVRKRCICQGILAALEERVVSEQEVREKWVDMRLSVPMLILHKTQIDSPLYTWSRVPALTKLAMFLAVFLFALCAEFVNVMYMVMTSGLGFETNYLGALSFGAIYVIAPFVVAEFLTHDLNAKQRCRFAMKVKMCALPMVFGGTALFAWKMGAMQDSFDVFGDASDLPWQPPLWMTLLLSMMLLAVTVMVLPSLWEMPARELWPEVQRDNPSFVLASNRVIAANHVFAEAAALRCRVLHVLEALDQDRIEFVGRCCAAIRLMQAEANAGIATARIKAAKQYSDQ